MTHRITEYKDEISKNGFTVINDVFNGEEIEQILIAIDQADTSNPTFRKSENLFAIRQFLKELPETKRLIFNQKLRNLIQDLFGAGYFVSKSIYFDKPETSNWFVAYHQDLTISVDQRIENEHYGPWTVKQNQFAVQPPLGILENNFTIRIHLDDTDEHNGGLKVISKSHLKGISRVENIIWENERELTCNTRKGGVMVMRPLLFHASDRTTNNHKRRVIHIEFSNQELAQGLAWSERINLEK